MGPTGHLAEPQTTEEHDEVTKNAKIILGYRLFLMRSTGFFSVKLKCDYLLSIYVGAYFVSQIFTHKTCK